MDTEIVEVIATAYAKGKVAGAAEERERRLRAEPHLFVPDPDDKRLRDGIVALIRQFEALAGQEDEDAAECAGVNKPGEDAYRMLAQGHRDVCFALRTLIGVSKISDL